MKKVLQPLRQGDVLLIPISSIPADAKDITPKTGRIVLQHGEVTGHAHAFYDNTYNINLRAGGSGERYLEVKALSALKHEEHTTVEVPAGKYLLPNQVEYSPEALQQVAD
jgi:hypothetical protein